MSNKTPYDGYIVTKQLDGVTKLGVPIYPGDLLTEREGVWTRQAPGICLTNIAIDETNKEFLEPVKYGGDGLSFWLDETGQALVQKFYEEPERG